MPPTFERDRELVRIAEALRAAADGEGRLVVIEGPAGIGKTRLVGEARTEAKALGFGRLKAVGDEPEQSVPWGLVRQLVDRGLARHPRAARDELLDGIAGAALRALEEAASGDETANARAMHKLWWTAADLSAERPVLITVDDAQWADTPSLRWLAYLARRLGDLALLLLVSTRPVAATDGALAELATGRHGERIVPGPLSVAGIGSLAGTGTAAAVATAIHAASGGNPFLAGQLAAELERGGQALTDPRSAGAVATLGPRTVARSAMAGLAPEAIRLAGAAAVLGVRSDPQLAASLAGVEPAADGLRAAGVLTDDVTALEFAHPVVREAVLAEVPGDRRAELQAAAARELRSAGAGDERVAAHLLQSAPGVFEDEAELLRRAAARSLSTGDAATAVTLLRRAGAGADADPALAAELGEALLRAGEADEARALLLGAARRGPAGRVRAQRLAAAGTATAATDGPDAAAALLRAEITAWDGDARDRLVLDARLAVMGAYTVPGRDLDPDAGADTPEGRVLLAMLTQSALYEPRPAAEVRDLGLRALGRGALAADPAGDLMAWGICVHALIAADATDAAAEEIALSRARVLPGGAPVDFVIVGMSAAHLAWRLGDLRAAESEATGILDALALVDHGPGRDALAAVGTRHAAVAQLEQGNVAEAAATLGRYEAPASGEATVPVRRLGQARAALALAQDDPGGALAHARRLGTAEQRAGIHTPTVDWRSIAALALGRLGREDEARALAEEQLALARSFDAASEVGAALRVRARLVAEGRLDDLHEAVERLGDAPARLVRAGALADLGEALAVAGRRSDARGRLTAALELADECGARGLARRAAEALTALGDRPARAVEAGFDELTASERRVAVLAADGRTNREIAQELFVTPKTVENHLRHAYAKLGVGGRRELAGALA